MRRKFLLLIAMTFVSVGIALSFATSPQHERNAAVLLRNVATPTPIPGLAGTIRYANAIGEPNPRFVSNVQITVTSSGVIRTIGVSSFPGGNYFIDWLGVEPGPYITTPSKTEVNGISSFDAAKTAQHAAGISVLVGNQRIAADVSGDGTISSFDAAMIARYTAGLSNYGSTGTWRFTPETRSYPQVTFYIDGQDYNALLMGEVSGDWTNTPPSLSP